MSVWRSVVTIRHASLGGIGTNTWHFRVPSNIADEPLVQLTEAVQGLQAFYGSLSGTTEGTGVLAGGTATAHDGAWTRLDEAGGTTFSVPGWSQGTPSSRESLPPACCIVAGWGTSQVGKRKRGRTFIGPISMDANDAGTPSQEALTVVRDAQDALIARFADATLDGAFGVWSVEDQTIRDFTSRTVHDKFAVLTSRRD